jgi:3-hydroxyacyl-CoA dehydrogenase
MSENDAEKYVNETLHRIEGQADLGAVKDCDLVIEAIVEDLDIKKSFYKDLASINANGTLATNTSSFPVGEMAAAGGCADRMVGLHYFNPVQVMKLVEVISLPETERARTDAVLDFCRATGKTAVECGDTPGFVVNRLLVPYIVQGIALVARGDATPEAVDTAMRLGAGHPMGPITLSDYVGNDINLACMEGWQKAHPGNPAFDVPEAMALLKEMVADGKLGRKTGHGFYKWEGNKPVGPRDDGWTPGPK